MSLDNELREVLTAQAERREGPMPDLVALRAGGLARRRRRRLALASSGLAILLPELERRDAAAPRQCFRHRDRRVAGERADLQDPLRARDRDEQSEEASLHRADQHAGTRAERDMRGGRDTGERL